MASIEEGFSTIDRTKLGDTEPATLELRAQLELERLTERQKFRAREDALGARASEAESKLLRTRVELDDAQRIIESQREVIKRLNKGKEEQKQESETDEVTGLLNKKGIRNRVESLMGWFKSERVVAEEHRAEPATSLNMLVIDLDSFKSINDRFGHDIGDLALVHVAQVLRSSLRENDKIARWGGDEFVVALMIDRQKSMTRATTDNRFSRSNEVRKALEANPFVYEDLTTDPPTRFEMPITGSIGAARWKQGESYKQLFNRADLAAKAAKERGKNRVVDANVEEDIAQQKAGGAAKIATKPETGPVEE
jgi:diguanylate cyclase